jgi:hypothetical protein
MFIGRLLYFAKPQAGLPTPKNILIHSEQELAEAERAASWLG